MADTLTGWLTFDYENWANDTVENAYRAGHQAGYIKGRRHARTDRWRKLTRHLRRQP